MPIEVIGRRGGMAELTCAFCNGQGIDPFGVLSEESLCPVCKGKNRVRVREPLRECAFCRGTGAHPDTRLTCTTCMGKGAVTVRQPVEECPRCQGSGAALDLNLACALCGGKGVVAVKAKR